MPLVSCCSNNDWSAIYCLQFGIKLMCEHKWHKLYSATLSRELSFGCWLMKRSLFASSEPVFPLHEKLPKTFAKCSKQYFLKIALKIFLEYLASPWPIKVGNHWRTQWTIMICRINRWIYCTIKLKVSRHLQHMKQTTNLRFTFVPVRTKLQSPSFQTT